MGRARKGNRRSRSNGNNNSSDVPDRINSSPRILDRDDDLLMYGAEDYFPPYNLRRRKHRNNIRKGNQNDGSRGSNDNPFNPLIENPFRQPNSDASTFQDQQGPRFQQPRNQNRGRGRNRTQRAHNSPNNHAGDRSNSPRSNHRYKDQHHGGPSPASTINGASNNHNHSHNHSHNHNHNSNNNHSHQDSFAPPTPPSSPARRARFCTECSAVRRANITLRNWLLAAIARATEVVDSWSDEVGVARGSADEMDWQPEPVIRVLILTTKADGDGGPGWEQGPPRHLREFTGDGFGTVGSWGNGAGYGNNGDAYSGLEGAARRDNYGTMGLSPWGSRPASTSPRPATAGWASGGLGIAGVFGSGNVSSALGFDDGAQGQMNAEGAWGNVDGGQQTVGIASPPDSPYP